MQRDCRPHLRRLCAGPLRVPGRLGGDGMIRRHVLKIDERWFDRLADGSKTAEVRKHDRDYQIGDEVVFVRDDWRPFSERENPPVQVIDATITHVLPASVFPDGLQTGYSVLSLSDISQPRDWDEGDRA